MVREWGCANWLDLSHWPYTQNQDMCSEEVGKENPSMERRDRMQGIKLFSEFLEESATLTVPVKISQNGRHISVLLLPFHPAVLKTAFLHLLFSSHQWKNYNNYVFRLDAVAYTCNPSTLGGWGGQITWGQEFETSLANMVKPPLLKIQNLARHGGTRLSSRLLRR